MLFLLLFAAWLLTLEAVLFLRLRGLLGFLQLLLFEGRQTGLGATGVLVGVVALFLRFGGCIPESGRRICQTERSRLQMLLVSQYTSTANGMATPEKMYMIGNIHSIIFCIISVCLFAALWAMLRFMLLYCMSHRQKHINATKMPMMILPWMSAVVKFSATFTPNTLVEVNCLAVAMSKAPRPEPFLNLPRAMYGMADRV